MTSEITRLGYDALRLHQDSLTRTLALLKSSGFETMVRQIQEQQAETYRMLENSLAAHYTELSKATRQLYDLSLSTTFTPNILEQVHASWLPELHRVAMPSEHLERIAQAALSDIAYDVSVTERFLSQFDYDVLGSHLNVQLSVISDVQSAMSSLWASYHGLAESFVSVDDFVQLPSFVLPEATQGLRVKGRALESLQLSPQLAGDDAPSETEIIQEDHGDTVGLSSLLGEIDPDLVPMYVGAVESLDGTNPDRERHVLTSLRTLWDEVFRVMAPDSAVTAWAEAQALPNEEYFHEERPTRRARLAYVLRNVNSDPITQYVDANVRAALKLHDLFQRVHNKSSGLNQEQLRVVLLDTRVSLEYFIRVWKW